MQRYNNYHKHDHVSNLFTVDCVVKAEDYIKKCVEYGHTSYFTTNHGSFGDIFEARTLCNKYGIKCVAGIEGYIVPNPLEKDKRNYHIIVIPKTDSARKQMNYVSSHANIDGYYYKPRFFVEDLLALDKDSIYITSACMAGLLRDEDSINQILIPLIKHFGGNVLLEVQNHNHQLQISINQKALNFQQKYGLRLIAANDSHYIDEQGKIDRLELLKGKGISYDDEDTFILDFPTAETMFDRFKNQNVLSEEQIEESINNTLIFDECEEIQLDDSIKMPTIYPELTPAERLEKLKKIVTKRFSQIVKEENIKGEDLQKYKDGIRYEMDIIEKTNEEIHMADYFLFNTKNVDLAVNKYGGVLTRGGRGSCASFYINRILGMTQLDRFKINLPIFPDRFISVARCLQNRSLADIDMNVMEQEPFVKASRELLGEHGCYPMYAPNTMQLSEAFRNVCRSKQLPYNEYNEIAKDIESYVDDKKWKPIIDEANRYVNTIVAGSVHPCAHLIMDKDIRYEFGIYRLGEFLCVLMTSSEADEYKFLKNDYLIVSVWKLIYETFKEVGIPIIPAKQLLEEIKDDQRIWDLFKYGLTCTLNQVDSDNGMQQAKRYGISSFEQGAFLAAAIRPSFNSWRERFLSHENYSTGSKDLDNVLSNTDHYILFQENLMQYFEWLGVTPAESIGLIKKISKKKIKPEDFQKLEERIKKQWVINTGSEDMFDETWEMIQGCMSYGFAAPHAAATSLDMCYGAYLKVHYPVQYYTVCFNNYAGDHVRTAKLTNELPYFGIKLKGIKFRYSKGEYTYDLENKIIYKGVGSIKFVSNTIADELYALRDNKYDTFIDLLRDIKENTSVNSKQLNILICIDFFSEFGEINTLLEQVKQFDLVYGKKQFKIDKVSELGIPEFLVAKYAGKKTAKMFSDVDTVSLLNDWVSRTTYSPTTIYNKLCMENEYLGYCVTTSSKATNDMYYVCGVTGYSKNVLSLYSIKTGEAKTEKYSKAKGNEIQKGALIKVRGEKSRQKYIKTGEDENGKPIFDRSEEREIVIDSYEILKQPKST